jgi:hypothetical protein
MRLLRLDVDVQARVLQIADGDPRLQQVTESRLRYLHGQDGQTQRQRLQQLMCGSKVDAIVSRSR